MTNKFLIAACLSLAAISVPAEAHEQDPALNNVYARLASARAANDLGGMTGNFAADGLLVDARPGPVISGAELEARMKPMLERLLSEKGRIDTAYRIERRSVIGEIALDAGFMRQTVSRPGAEPMTRYARFLVTMKRGDDGQWRIIGDASMPAQQSAFEGVVRQEGLHFDG
jgi:uncharacterized protein (TIGR02246 family)